MASQEVSTGSVGSAKAASAAQQSWAFMGTLVGVAAIAAYFLLASKLGPGFAIPVGILGVCGLTAVGILLGPVGKAVSRRIDAGGSGASHQELEHLHCRLDELESGQTRMAELEERLDFAERLMTRGREESAVDRAP
ncbi:MAG: hypothetical protein ABJC74_07520 [Gemmatimonadota bacterium]